MEGNDTPVSYYSRISQNHRDICNYINYGNQKDAPGEARAATVFEKSRRVCVVAAKAFIATVIASVAAPIILVGSPLLVGGYIVLDNVKSYMIECSAPNSSKLLAFVKLISMLLLNGIMLPITTSVVFLSLLVALISEVTKDLVTNSKEQQADNSKLSHSNPPQEGLSYDGDGQNTSGVSTDSSSSTDSSALA